MDRMSEYNRGRRDAARYSEVRSVGGAWLAVFADSGNEAWIADPINDEYLDGLSAGGCAVLSPRGVAA